MDDQAIVISPVYGNGAMQRLNFIAGRSLSQQEFSLMQRYVDERCEDLLVARQPGIVSGLEVQAPQTKEEFSKSYLRINPGVGVSWSGRVVSIRLPLQVKWDELRQEYLARQVAEGEKPPVKLADGFYFLTLRRQVRILDELKKTDPCTRTELDPLRDTRVATLAQLNLQPLAFEGSWLGYSRQRVAMQVFNRLLGRHPLTEPVTWQQNPPEYKYVDEEPGGLLSENPHEIKLALIKVVDNYPQWVDPQVGRLLVRDNAVQMAMLDYWHSILNAPARFRLDGEAVELDNKKNLQQLLDVDYLPAAGKFPEQLISHLAGKVAKNHLQWQRPELQFFPYGLQIELVPVPANSVMGVIRQEVSRGVIDLSGVEMDRLRLMVAVNPDDYHPKLMDLPEIDKQLVTEDLVNAQYQAYLAYKAWAEAYWNLYHKIEVRAPKIVPNLTLKTRAIFSGLYLTHIPEGAFADLKNQRALRRELAIPDYSPAPKKAVQIIGELQTRRSEELRAQGNPPASAADLPRPWSLLEPLLKAIEEPVYENVEVPEGDGLIAERIDTREDIEEIEQFIVRTNQLIDEVRDYLSSQRQQLDSITVSFSTLAGGIPGDGTGLKLMRWSDKLSFATTVKPSGG